MHAWAKGLKDGGGIFVFSFEAASDKTEHIVDSLGCLKLKSTSIKGMRAADEDYDSICLWGCTAPLWCSQKAHHHRMCGFDVWNVSFWLNNEQVKKLSNSNTSYI